MKTFNTIFTIFALGTIGCGGAFDDADALKTGGEAGAIGVAGAEPTTGGTETGGSENTGGTETGGNSGTGGNVTGGVSTGGNITGGTETGGTETGGFATGGSTGGTETGGSAGNIGCLGASLVDGDCSEPNSNPNSCIKCISGCIASFGYDMGCAIFYGSNVPTVVTYCNDDVPDPEEGSLLYGPDSDPDSVKYGECNTMEENSDFRKLCCKTD